jgi:ABC-type transport system involved in multi-copper enzyme maturation permease subunit
MTTTSTSATTRPRAGATDRDRVVTPGRVLASEWIKLRSLRSTRVVVALVVLAVIGLGAFMTVGELVAGTAVDGGGDPTAGALAGVGTALFAVVALGAMSVTGEYATGTIRPTFTAVPARLPVVWAKAAVVLLGTAAVTLVAVVSAYAVAAAVRAAGGRPVALGEPGVVRALAGAALYLGVTGALAVGFGWLVRRTAGAVAAVLAFLFLPSLIVAMLPVGFRALVGPYLPDNAGSAVMSVAPAAGQLPPWTGLALYTLYAVGALLLGALVVRRRDA